MRKLRKRRIMTDMMEQRQMDVEAQIHDLTAQTPAPQLVGELRGFACELLDAGYDRELLYDDIQNVYVDVSERGDERIEDALIHVADDLTGFCSPSSEL